MRTWWVPRARWRRARVGHDGSIHADGPVELQGVNVFPAWFRVRPRIDTCAADEDAIQWCERVGGVQGERTATDGCVRAGCEHPDAVDPVEVLVQEVDRLDEAGSRRRISVLPDSERVDLAMGREANLKPVGRLVAQLRCPRARETSSTCDVV